MEDIRVDKFNHPIDIGDWVVFSWMRNTSIQLAKGFVVGFTPKGVKVQTYRLGWDTPDQIDVDDEMKKGSTVKNLCSSKLAVI